MDSSSSVDNLSDRNESGDLSTTTSTLPTILDGEYVLLDHTPTPGEQATAPSAEASLATAEDRAPSLDTSEREEACADSQVDEERSANADDDDDDDDDVITGTFHPFVPASERWYVVVIGPAPGVYQGATQALAHAGGPNGRFTRHASLAESIRVFEIALLAGEVRRVVVPPPIDTVLTPLDFPNGYLM
ncbi:hypothetical protein GALMADRAFT_139650 [Galerina marginata CBS 339.88]|uniref:Uncharacterized protein n=1 Tax=Galerina marginata (strain CBS 339.88) TaxID=685588 RepID=A0A067TCP3_GALM3|nr:hypothetical protein GALMADRAFT_139650 [Galerina marginata CBS 339.88]